MHFLECHSQNAFKNEKELIKKSETFFVKADYTAALPLYSQLLSLYPKNPLYNYRFGVSMLFSDKRDAEKPLKYLEYAVKNSGIPESYYYLGLAYHRNYRFAEAIKMYEAYKKVSRSSAVEKLNVNRQIEMCRNGLELLLTINDLYVLDKKAVNTKAYFRLYNLKKFGGKFLAKPENLKTKTDKKQKDNSPVFFSDSNEVIYYASYGDDLRNGKDIYYSSKISDKAWSKPVRLSDVINTPYDEDFPYLMPDGKTLYFCSKGHNSMGGYDIFVTTFDSVSDEWMTPINIDFAINTPYDDYMFVTDKDSKYAYFSSDRNSPPNQVSVYLVRIDKRPFSSENILLSGDTSLNISKDSLYAKSIAILKDKARLDVNATPEMFGDTLLAMNIQKDTSGMALRHDQGIGNNALNDSLYTIQIILKDSVANVAFSLADKANREKNDLIERKYSAYSYAKKYSQLSKQRLNQAKQIEDISASENNPKRKASLDKTAGLLKKSSADYYALSVAAGKLADNYKKQAEKKEKAHERYVNFASRVQIYLAKDQMDSAQYYVDIIHKEETLDTLSNTIRDLLTELNKSSGDTLQKAYNEAFVNSIITEVDAYTGDTTFIDNKLKNSREVLAYNTGISGNKLNSFTDTLKPPVPVVQNKLVSDTTAITNQVTNVYKKEPISIADKKQFAQEKARVLKLSDNTIKRLEKEQIIFKKQADTALILSQKNNRQADVLLKEADSILNKANDNQQNINIKQIELGYKLKENSVELRDNSVFYNNLAKKLNDSADAKNKQISNVNGKKKVLSNISGKDSLADIQDFLIRNNPPSKLYKPSLNKLLIAEKEEKQKKDSVELTTVISLNNQDVLISANQKIHLLKEDIDDLQKQRDKALNISNAKSQQSEQKLKEADISLNHIQSSMPFTERQDLISNAQRLKKETVGLGREAVTAYNIYQMLDSLVNTKVMVLNNLSVNLLLSQFELKSGNYKTADSSLALIKPVIEQKEPAYNSLHDLSSSDYIKNERNTVAEIETENAKTMADIDGFSTERDNLNDKMNSTHNKKKKAILNDKLKEIEFQTDSKKKQVEINRNKLDSVNVIIYNKEQEQIAYNHIKNDILNTPLSYKDTSHTNKQLLAENIAGYRNRDIFSEHNAFFEIDTARYLTVNNQLTVNTNKPHQDTSQTKVLKEKELSSLNDNKKLPSLIPVANNEPADTLKALLMFENAKLISNETAILIQKRQDPLLTNTGKLEIDKRVTALKSESDSLYNQAVKIYSVKKNVSPEDAGNILINNSVKPEIPNIIQNCNKLSENMNIQVSDIRNKALGNSNTIEKNKLNRQADSLESLALNYQFQGIEYQMLDNKNHFHSNVLIIENIRPVGVADDRLSVAALLEKEANMYLIKSDDNRKKAVESLYLNSGLMLLQDALTFEKQALDKQQQAISIYRKINPKAPDDKVILAQLAFKNNTVNAGNNNSPVSPEIKDTAVVVNNYINNNQHDTTTNFNNKIIVYNENNPIPENEKLPEGLVFKVQIMASKSLVNVLMFKGISPLSTERKPDFPYMRYMAGLFTLYKDALSARDKLRKTGFDNAFVVAYFNGNRITIGEALAVKNNVKGANQSFAIISDQGNNGQNNLPTYENILSFSGLYYSVQIGVFSKQRLFPGILKSAPIYYDRYNNRYWRYFSGKFDNLPIAKNHRVKMIDYGIRDAFIVAFLNGKRLKSITESRLYDSISEKKQPVLIPQTVINPTTQVIFTVQIGAFVKDIPLGMFPSVINDEKLDIHKYQREDKMYIIFSGNFEHFRDAVSYKARLVSLGFKDAFVIALQNSKRIPVTGEMKLK